MSARLCLGYVTALSLSCVFAANAEAQTYRFSVPTASMNVDVRSDGTIGVDYTFVFANDADASPIDVVDIGMPNDDYDLSTMTAAVDGAEVTDISKSTFIETGVQASLHDRKIEPDATGTFTFHYDFQRLVFSDTTNDALASFRITPTWFDSSSVLGSTHLAVLVHLPPGVRPEEAIWQSTPFTGKSIDPVDGRTVIAWDWAETRLVGPHLVGVSFPRRGMTGIVRITKLDLLLLWWSSAGAVSARVVVALVLLLAFTIVYFRFTGKTGIVPWLLATGACIWLWWASPMAELVSLVVLPLCLVAMERWTWRSKTRYLPPIASVEGGGIKRGLTAPEAAVLLEAPLSRVLTMVIFGMLKKGLLVQVAASPLRVRVPEPLRTASADAKRAAAAIYGVVIHGYEPAFIDAIVLGTYAKGTDASQTLESIDFTDAVHALVASTADRLIGFDVDETKKYYRQIVERAWTEAKSVGEIARRDEVIDKNLEWLLAGDDFDRRFSSFGSGYHYYPGWMRPISSASPSVVGGGGAKPPTSIAAPSFGDVSASFAGWFSGVTGQIAGTITPSSKAGVIDLSGFDSATGAVLKAIAENSGRGGGGGGGGGGCACAGCACACACAGGGR